MARWTEVVVHAECDLCQAAGDKVAATVERTVTLDGGRPTLLDLCDDHDKVFALVEEYLPYGAPAPEQQGARPGRKKMSVPDCPLCGKDFRTRGAFGTHLKRIHGTTIKEVREAGHDID